MPTRRKLPLLDVDPDLGVLVPADRLEAARHELDVEVHRLEQGPWSAGAEHANPEHVGLLLLDGVISREVVVSDTVSTELLGPGDVVRPWSIQEPAGLLQLTIRWNALTESRMAVLDRRFGAQLGRWPEVNAALIDRVNGRAQRLAVTQAISQLNRVDRRLLSLFWHLAERWGRMTPDGVAIPLTLSHRMLGQLVGARRPTVSTAISELAEREQLVRRDDGSWLLTGDPIGMPTADVERVIPIRRRLFGRTPADLPELATEVAFGPRAPAPEQPDRAPEGVDDETVRTARA
jgi:CRP/FNR family cyclic AMP-dependent transcriptional regulator